MYLARKRLYQLLGLQSEKQHKEDQVTVTRSSEGPGEYDVWGPLEGRSDNFLQFNSVILDSSPKKKIILSCIPTIDEFYIAFFNAVLTDEKLELHLWTANGLTQITSVRQLADALPLIRETSVQKVRNILSRQQAISLQDCVLLDACRYAGIQKAETNLPTRHDLFDLLKDEKPSPALPEVTELDLYLSPYDDARKKAALLYPERITSYIMILLCLGMLVVLHRNLQNNVFGN